MAADRSSPDQDRDGGGRLTRQQAPKTDRAVAEASGAVPEGTPEDTLLLIRAGSGVEPERELFGERACRAKRWALELDATLRTRLNTGGPVQVRVPATNPWQERVHSDTVDEYRKLRLGVRELIRPWLLDREELHLPILAPLFPFQRAGVEWLVERPSGAILADDMGLGKTVQVIAAVRLLFNRALVRRVLVLCPRNLLANWEAEFEKWGPELGVAVVNPSGGRREAAWRALAWRRHVLLTNYEQMRDPPEALRTSPPDLIVADEAHRLRKRTAKATIGVSQLAPARFWALTGTPLERDMNDLATILSLVEPRRFSARDAQLHPSSLRVQARPFLLRRRKAEVLDDLPPVRETTERIELTPAQRRAYRATVAEIRRQPDTGNELALLTRLRQICDFDRATGASSKADRIMELLPRIHEQGEKAVVFAVLLAPLRNLQQQIGDTFSPRACRLLVGEMNLEEREQTVREFRTDPSVLVLLASTRVGGEGLTLVEANHAFLFDQWWNPSTNRQATDRIVRIGQQNPVRIYRFCCRDTIEERLETILRDKQELFDSAVEELAVEPGWAMDRVRAAVGTERLLSAAR